MKFFKTFVGDLARFAFLAYVAAHRSTIWVQLETALDALVNDPSVIAAWNKTKSLGKDFYECFSRRLRLAIMLAVIGVGAGVAIGAAGFFGAVEMYLPRVSRWTAIVGFLAFAIPFMLASAIMLWELLKGQVAKQAFIAILVTLHHGGATLKQLLPQIIVGNWSADPILREFDLLVTRTINTLWSVFIGVNTAVLFVLVTGIYTNPLAFFATAIACILAVAWAVRYSKNDWILKTASFAMIVATLLGAAGWSLWGLYTRSETYHEGTKSEAVARAVNGQEDDDDKKLLGVAYKDIVMIRKIRAKEYIDKCDVDTAEALQKRANASLNGSTDIVSMPKCAVALIAGLGDDEGKAGGGSKTSPQGAVLSEKPPVDPKAERTAALNRILTNAKVKPVEPTDPKDPNAVKAAKEETKKKAAAQEAADMNILNGVYADAVEIRKIRAKGERVDECDQKRLPLLAKRVAAYINGQDYVGIMVPGCDKNATSMSGGGGAGKPAPNPKAAAAKSADDDLDRRARAAARKEYDVVL